MTDSTKKENAQRTIKNWSEAYWEADPETATLLRILNVELTERQIRQIGQIQSVMAKCSIRCDEDTKRTLLEKI